MKSFAKICLTLFLCSLFLSSDAHAGWPFTGNGPFNTGGSSNSAGAVSSLTTTGAGGASTLSGGVLNVPVYGNANLPIWSAALKNAKNGVSNAHVCYVGDSTTYGIGSNGTAGFLGVNSVLLSWPVQLSTMLATDYGIKSTWQTFFGDSVNGTTPSFGSNDVRVTLGNSWTQDTSTLSLGYSTYKATTSTNSLSFLPTVNVDTFKIFYVMDTSQGVLQADVNGSGAVTQATSGTAGVGTLTTTATLGSNTLNLKWSSGGQVNVIGIEAWDSTQTWVIQDLAGAPALRASQASVTTKAYNPGNSAIYSSIGCNLTIIKLDVNDATDAVSIPTFKTQIQTIITAAQTAGSDVILSSDAPQNPTGVTQANQQLYVDALRALANTDNLPYIDTFASWQTYAIANAQGLYTDTFVHSTAAGYYLMAKEALNYIFPIPQVQGQEDFLRNTAIKVSTTGKVGIGWTAVTPPPDLLDVTGGVGVGTTAIVSGTRLTVWGNQPAGTGPIVAIGNSNTTNYTNMDFHGTGRTWTMGTGNGSESGFGIPNKFFIYDSTGSTMDFVIDTGGNIGIGTVSPQNSSKLQINGTIETGVAGTTIGSILLAGNTSGVVTVKPQATAGTYNLNLPITAGSTGNFLTSSAGGSSAMTWTAAGTGMVVTGGNLNSNAVYQMSFQPGLVAAVTNTKSVFSKVSKASTVDNIEASASIFSCAGNPTITMYECGTDASCATSPTTIGTSTVTAAGQAFDGTVSNAAITAGDYVAFAISAGTCTSLDIAATAQVHSN